LGGWGEVTGILNYMQVMIFVYDIMLLHHSVVKIQFGGQIVLSERERERERERGPSFDCLN